MLRLLCVVFALVIGLAFHSRNHQPVTLDFYTKTIEIPLSWVVVAALSFGALLGALALLPRLLRTRRLLRRELRRAKILQSPAAEPSLPGPVTSTPDGH
jgi:uncharacterized integral membrane protein